MAHVTPIDQWKCLDIRCSHRWDTTVIYAQLHKEAPSRSGLADGTQMPARRQDFDAMSGSG
jgi:hypothetical protein